MSGDGVGHARAVELIQRPAAVENQGVGVLVVAQGGAFGALVEQVERQRLLQHRRPGVTRRDDPDLAVQMDQIALVVDLDGDLDAVIEGQDGDPFGLSASDVPTEAPISASQPSTS